MLAAGTKPPSTLTWPKDSRSPSPFSLSPQPTIPLPSLSPSDGLPEFLTPGAAAVERGAALESKPLGPQHQQRRLHPLPRQRGHRNRKLAPPGTSRGAQIFFSGARTKKQKNSFESKKIKKINLGGRRKSESWVLQRRRRCNPPWLPGRGPLPLQIPLANEILPPSLSLPPSSLSLAC